jgi:hypothetical protein
MDRTNPFRHYEPGNTRWAWVALQCVNQMRYKGSGYKGGIKHMEMNRSNSCPAPKLTLSAGPAPMSMALVTYQHGEKVNMRYNRRGGTI